MEIAVFVLVIAAVAAFRWWVKYGGAHSTHCHYCREPKSPLARVCPHCNKPQPGYEGD